jgi:hypothetical protein
MLPPPSRERSWTADGLPAQRKSLWRREFYREGRATIRETRGNVHVGRSAARLERFAHLAVAQEQEKRSARLFGAAEALRASIGGTLPPNARAERECRLTAARAALGEEAYAAA